MKLISILRLHPGVDTQSEALANFMKHGPVPGTEWLLASRDSKTYISLGDPDEDNLAQLAMYAPYFDIETIPVVEVDGAWVEAMQTGIDSRVRL